MNGVDPEVIESLAQAAWPPSETRRVAGWRLHHAGGFSRRANSAAPSSVTVGIEEIIDSARRWYADRDLPLIVRITPATYGVDVALDQRGFTKEGLTDVMTASISPADSPNADAEIRVTIAESPPAAWLDLQAVLVGVSRDLRSSWLGILRRIEAPTAFALARVGSDYVAAGLAVHGGEWVGLFEINVDGGARRRGYGRALSRALLDWGAAAGAGGAYLQVTVDNVPARELYRSLGFEQAYRYWYRRAPEP